MQHGQTNREKRAALDAKLRQENPRATEEEILEKREAYLEKRYGTFGHRALPLPQKRGNWQRPLTMKTLEAQVLDGQERGTFLMDSIGFAVLFLPLGILFLVGNFLVSFDFFLFLVGLMFCAFGGIPLWNLPRKHREDKETIAMIQKGQFRIFSYRVLDMSHQDESSATDDNADWHFYLHLEQTGQSGLWVYDCGEGFYEQVREGDTVHMVYCTGKEEPVFVFREENWVPDAQIRAFMRLTQTT